MVASNLSGRGVGGLALAGLHGCIWICPGLVLRSTRKPSSTRTWLARRTPGFFFGAAGCCRCGLPFAGLAWAAAGSASVLVLAGIRLPRPPAGAGTAAGEVATAALGAGVAILAAAVASAAAACPGRLAREGAGCRVPTSALLPDSSSSLVRFLPPPAAGGPACAAPSCVRPAFRLSSCCRTRWAMDKPSRAAASGAAAAAGAGPPAPGAEAPLPWTPVGSSPAMATGSTGWASGWACVPRRPARRWRFACPCDTASGAAVPVAAAARLAGRESAASNCRAMADSAFSAAERRPSTGHAKAARCATALPGAGAAAAMSPSEPAPHPAAAAASAAAGVAMQA